MPQFAYSAMDKAGDTYEGSVNAADMMQAADQIREMGYTPVMVQLIANEYGGVPRLEGEGREPIGLAGDRNNGSENIRFNEDSSQAAQQTLAMAAATATAAAPRPAAFDLTQTVTEYPAAANSLLATLSGPGGEETEILQPWERGGHITAAPQAPALDGTMAMGPTQTLSPSGAVITRAMPPVGSGVTQPMQAPPPRMERPGAPYSGRTRETSVYERFKEVFIYPLRSGVVVKDLAAFYRQFATLIDAGLPIYQALVALESNTQNSKLKEIARAGQAQVQAGGRFSDVMASYPWIFPPMQVEMIRAAEQGGMLDEMLRDVAGYVEHELSIRRLIKAETLYPKLVMFMALMILGKPGIFEAMPAFSKLIIGSMGKLEYTFNNYLSDTVGFALLWLGPIFAAVVIFRLFLFNTPGVREAYDMVKTSLPGLGGLIRMFVVAKFMRVYASLYRAGFGMTSILQIAGDACGNVLLRNAAQSAIPYVERGGLVSDALARARFLPPMAVDMFRTGETTGGMDQLLSKMADHYEAEAKTKAHQMALIFSACVFLLVAFLVGIAVIRFYMGIGSSISSQAGEN